MIEKKVFIKMNKDVSSKDLKDGEYRHAENLVAVSDGIGGSARLENVRGMLETGMPVPVGSVNIGLWNYKEGNKIYGFYSGSTDTIIEYDGVLNNATVLIQNNILGFSTENPVYDVFYIDGLLYFNDGKINGIRKINIDYAKTGALNTITNKNILSLIRKPPLETILVERVTDTSTALEDSQMDIRITPYQFAERYVYNDNEVSVLSPISVVAPALDFHDPINTNEYNAIKVTLSIDQNLIPLIKRVELLVRTGNDGNWSLYEKFPSDGYWESPNRGATIRQKDYLFLDNRGGAVLPSSETSTSSESISRQSKAMALASNRLFTTSTLEEYDLATDDWNAFVQLEGKNNPETELNDDIYYPKYFKDRSIYTFGLVFFDEFGRKSAPEVNGAMTKRFPKFSSPYEKEGLHIYHHPDAWKASIKLTGKPPVWARKYQVARTANQSYNSWVKLKMLAKPVYVTNKTEEPESPFLYLDNNTWYYDINYYLKNKLNSSSPESEIINLTFGVAYIDLIIPDQIPIPIDEKSIIRLAFEYPTIKPDGVSIDETLTAQIVSIEQGFIRIKGFRYLSWMKTFYDDAAFTRGKAFIKAGGVGFGASSSDSYTDDEWKCIRNDENFLHIEILNPIKVNETPLMYEVGRVYDIEGAGTDSRSFLPDSAHDYLEGDCYYASYPTRFVFWDGFVDRLKNSISYPSLSPIADVNRTGSPLSIDEEGNPVSPPIETGLYWKTAHDSKGRVTVQIPDQKELKRGSQLRYSRTFIQNSKVNGLSNFPEENKYPLDSDRGDIVKLVPISDDILVSIHTRSITSIYLKRKFISTGENQEFLVQSDSIIGDDRRLSLDIGSQNPESIVTQNSNVYGFDAIMSEPWRRGQDGITPLASIYGMKTYFEKKGQEIREIKTLDPSAVIKIIGGYDPWMDMYILTFSEITYTNGEGDMIKTIPETIGFSERVKAWVSFYSFKPEQYSQIMNNLVSTKDQSLWRHSETAERNLFYGDYNKSKITIVANKENDHPNIYQNVAISSSNKWSLTCKTVEGKESLLSISNFTERDGVFYADILRDKNTASDTLNVGQTPLLHGEKMIGEVLEISIENDDSNIVTLDAVYIGFSPMTGHLLSSK